MSEPRTIDAYLAALNVSLEVGLRSRRRIFFEVDDHLREATREQLGEAASEQDAQQRAITAFGSPQEVAARFEAGLIGRLDRRLALGARRLHRWTTLRPWGLAVVGIGLALLLGAAFATVGVAFGGHSPLVAATGFLSVATIGMTMYLLPSVRRRLSGFTTSRLTAQSTLAGVFVFPAVSTCLILLGGEARLSIVFWFGSLLLVQACWLGLLAASELAVARVAAGHAGRDEDDRGAWAADHPLWAALAVAAPLPLALVVLVAVQPGPVGLRVALVLLLAVIAAIAAAVVRLEQARREQAAYRPALTTDPAAITAAFAAFAAISHTVASSRASSSP